MTIPSSIYFITASFLASLIIYFRKAKASYLRFFPLFLFATVIVEVIGAGKRSKEIHTAFIYNFFTTFEFIFYFWVLRDIINESIPKKVISIFIWLYPAIALINIIFIQKIYHFHTITYSIGCLLIVIICAYYFFELFQLTYSVDLLRDPAFWICSGLLFFYCCSFPIFGLGTLLNTAPRIITRNLSVILNLLNILLYSSFTIAFLCRLRMKKSIL